MIEGRLTVKGDLNSALPVALYKTTAFLASAKQMQAMDTTTGQVAATIKPQGTPVDPGEFNTDPATPPLLVTIQGTATVLTSFVVEQAGTGTQASHTVVEVNGTNADTGKVMWRLTLRPPQWDTTSLDLRTTVVGADGDSAVIRVSTDDGYHAAAYGIDLNNPRQVWSTDKVRVDAVADGAAVGAVFADGLGTVQRPAGFDIATGKRLWTGERSYDVEASVAGPQLIRVQGANYDSEENYDRLVEPRTSRVQRTVPTDMDGAECIYDGQSTLVCHGTSGASGLDASNGKELWQLPDEQADRIAPEVTTAWHGRVYGTANNSPVALDARTGKDLPNPGTAPLLVNESVGIALGDSGLVAYPTNS
ncbi:PQQ-binding-like beta-propeller repeat protein [Streptomyces sp. NPDC005774]|uniref:outer membrane protein assembly factor BamB family protein n=1 Tax=Streptomyces sp. NPDC005774 TaxID=3364728 RepID=UPI0036BFE60B